MSDNEALRFKDAELINVITHYIDEPDALRRGEDQQRAMLKSARYQLLRYELEVRRLRLEVIRVVDLREAADLRNSQGVAAVSDALWPS